MSVAGMIRRRRSIGLVRLVGLGLLLALSLLRYSDPAPLERLRLALFDQYMQAYPRVAEAPSVAIVDLDEASLNRIGQWPWSRGLLARLTDEIGKAGAAVIAFDMVFPEPDRLSPPRLAESLPSLTPEMAARLRSEADTDQLFAGAIARNRVVLGRSGLPKAVAAGFEPPAPLAVIGGDISALLPTYPGVLRNLPELEQAAAGIGLFSVVSEADGIIRRVPMVANAAGVLRPTLMLETLRIATGGDALVVKRDSAGVAAVSVGGHPVATEGDGRFWLHFAPHAPERFIPAADILEGRIDPARLKDKAVLIGSSAIGLQDLRATPLGVVMPGVEIHAQALEAILAGTMLRRPNDAQGVEILAGLLLGLAMILLVPRLGTALVLVLGFAVAAAMIFVGFYLFQQHRLLIDIAYPLLAGLSVFLVMVFANYWREERQKREIRAAFQHYLAPALVERLAEEPELLRLGGETRDLTILFADLRGFTAVAESYRADPQALTALMNRLMSRLSGAIIDSGGTIDKFMGDAVMAFWNAPLDEPDHAAKAVEAALEMRHRLAALEAERGAEAKAEGRAHLPLNIGIGINSGACVVGNMGSEARFDYTALGDAVNLAARLEGLTVQLGAPILLGEASVARLGGRFTCREIGETRVKGKSETVRVFALDDVARQPDQALIN